MNANFRKHYVKPFPITKFGIIAHVLLLIAHCSWLIAHVLASLPSLLQRNNPRCSSHAFIYTYFQPRMPYSAQCRVGSSFIA